MIDPLETWYLSGEDTTEEEEERTDEDDDSREDDEEGNMKIRPLTHASLDLDLVEMQEERDNLIYNS